MVGIRPVALERELNGNPTELPISQHCLRLLWVAKSYWKKSRFLYRLWASWLIKLNQRQ